MIESTIGAIYLNVSNLDKLVAFYEHHIGLQVHERNRKTASLGVGENDLLVLTETPNRSANPQATGLFHLALLVPDQAQLARTLKHFADVQTPLQGMSDHLVSEAIYLADPDGNGIEIYHDRPREAWYSDDKFLLDTIPLDTNKLMSSITPQTATWDGQPKGTTIGHIHLNVSDIHQTEMFYQNVIGMDIMLNMGSATFMSYEGYHHHIGANIWRGRQKRTGKELGLEKFDLYLNDSVPLDLILGSVQINNIKVREQNNTYTLHDPSNNQIVIYP